MLRIYIWLISILFSNIFSSTVYTVDAESSTLEWVGSKVTGSHNGFIDFSSGSVAFIGEEIQSAELIVDMSSIKNTDISNPKYRTYLEDHLKSEDFFGVDSFPNSKIIFNNWNEISDKTGDIEITCDLIIKGITNKITFPVSLQFSEDKVLAIGSLNVDRTLYDIKYKSKTIFSDIGDSFIYDEFTLNFKIVANQIK